MTSTMNAMVLTEHGGPEVLHMAQLPRPEPGPGEVRVRIKAVALNHLDLWTRKGGPHFKLEYPHRLGSDIVGEIDALGPGARGTAGSKVVVQPGLSCMRCEACLGGHDNLCRHYKILGENTQGGYAEYIVVPDVNLAPYPERLDWHEAAASILTNLTAWQMVVHKARVQPGDTVLVQGAGSGVGVAAIQIAKLYGARVIATASSQDKLAKAAELGADITIDYTTQDFVAESRQATGKRGVDVVIEHVGGEVFEKSIRAVRNGGRIVTCGATAGFHPAIDLRHIFFRQVEVLGSTMGSKADLVAVLGHVAAGRIKPVVHEVLPLARAADAHRLLEARRAFGKVVLVLLLALLVGCSFRAGSYNTSDSQAPIDMTGATDMNMIVVDAQPDMTAVPTNKVRLVDLTDIRITGAPHANFPVLFATSQTWLRSMTNQGDVASESGHDIYFSSDQAGLQRLSHEVELYSPSAGTLFAWVEIPSLTATTTFYIHYGDKGITTSQQDVAGTWTAYDMVMHFDGTTDSTGKNATVATVGTADQNGRFDRARLFDGTDDGIDMGTNAVVDNLWVGGGTIEAWINADTFGGGALGRIADKGSGTGWAFFVDNGNANAGWTQTLSFFHGASGFQGFWRMPINSFTLDTWHHVAVSFNKDAITNDAVIYFDGAPAIVTEEDIPSGTFFDDDLHPLVVGNRPDGTRSFAGLLDEYRMATTQRTSDWILTSYRNQADPGGFYTISDPL